MFAACHPIPIICRRSARSLLPTFANIASLNQRADGLAQWAAYQRVIWIKWIRSIQGFCHVALPSTAILCANRSHCAPSMPLESGGPSACKRSASSSASNSSGSSPRQRSTSSHPSRLISPSARPLVISCKPASVPFLSAKIVTYNSSSSIASVKVQHLCEVLEQQFYGIAESTGNGLQCCIRLFTIQRGGGRCDLSGIFHPQVHTSGFNARLDCFQRVCCQRYAGAGRFSVGKLCFGAG